MEKVKVNTYGTGQYVIEPPKYRTLVTQIGWTSGVYEIKETQRLAFPYCVFAYQPRCYRPILGICFANEYPNMKTKVYAPPIDNIYYKEFSNYDCCMSGYQWETIQEGISQFWQEQFYVYNMEEWVKEDLKSILRKKHTANNTDTLKDFLEFYK